MRHVSTTLTRDSSTTHIHRIGFLLFLAISFVWSIAAHAVCGSDYFYCTSMYYDSGDGQSGAPNAALSHP
jgi:hypothetical protein